MSAILNGLLELIDFMRYIRTIRIIDVILMKISCVFVTGMYTGYRKPPQFSTHNESGELWANLKIDK